MSHAAAHSGHGHAGAAPSAAQLSHDNINLSGGAGFSLPMMGAGAAAIIAGVVVAKGTEGGLAHGLAAYHVATMAILAICLGATFFVLIWNLLNAGWSATIRRQAENIMSFLPYAFLLIVPTLVIETLQHGVIFQWMNPANYGDPLLFEKAGYFFGPRSVIDHATHEPVKHFVFPVFFFARAAFYGVFWTFISRRMVGLSLRQDQTGDRWLTAEARTTSAWGMLVFALTTAFASFDWLMSLDYRFFSTMWGVWYFAAAAFSSIALVSLILARLLAAGKLKGCVTSEHFHDLGKLLFSFTVFWAYISFSQYFLIWYSNIPEETAFYIFRKQGDWDVVRMILIAGHFIVPFLLLVSRVGKKSFTFMSVMAVFALAVHGLDLFFAIRPMVDAHNPGIHGVGPVWIDVIVFVGVCLVFGGYLLRRIASVPLVALNDPRISESLEHRNYV
ncbi:MAG: hypothetical protein ACOYN0_00295 [Phycisphaerales bacterium]